MIEDEMEVVRGSSCFGKDAAWGEEDGDDVSFEVGGASPLAAAAAAAAALCMAWVIF